MRLVLSVDIDDSNHGYNLVVDDLKGARVHREDIRITTDTNVYVATIVSVQEREVH